MFRCSCSQITNSISLASTADREFCPVCILRGATGGESATTRNLGPVSGSADSPGRRKVRRVLRCRLDRVLGGRRPAGHNPTASPLRSMQTGQNSIAPENSLPQLGQVRWGSVLMGLTALQPQPEPKEHHAPPSGAKSASTAPGKLLSRSTSNCVFLYTSASNHVSEQNSCRWCPAASRVDNDLRRWGGSKLTAVNRRLSRSP